MCAVASVADGAMMVRMPDSAGAQSWDRDLDLRLMARVASEERAAQTELVGRVVGRVRRLTRALLRDSADADDAVQLSLLEILGSARGYRGEASLERWVDRVVARTTLRIVRQGRRRDALVDAAADPDSLASARPATTDASQDITRWLDDLSDDRRTVLILRHVMGHSIEEIAELTGVSANTVKDRLVSALAQVRTRIRRERVIDGSREGT